MKLLSGLLLAILIAYLAYRARSLDRSGAYAAFVVGTVILVIRYAVSVSVRHLVAVAIAVSVSVGVAVAISVSVGVAVGMTVLARTAVERQRKVGVSGLATC